MTKILIRLLKILGGFLIFVLLLLLGVGFLVNSSSMQNKLLSYSTELLAEKLDTKVHIDSVSVNVFMQHLLLSGVVIEDQQQRRMFDLRELSVSMNLLPLLENKIDISSVRIKGVQAILVKPSADEPANFQFVIDAFKKKKTDDPEKAEKKTTKRRLQFDINQLTIERVSVKYNDSDFSLERLTYQEGLLGGHEGMLKGLSAQWMAKTKKGEQECKASIQQLSYQEKKNVRKVVLNKARFANDNRLPRKNVGKPKRGAFDAGHIDAVTTMKLTITLLEKDSLRATIDECDVKDDKAGIHVKELTLALAANKELINLKDINVGLENTSVHVDSATMQLPSKKRNVKLAYSTSVIKGRTLLKDIAVTFAPVLKNFTLPLSFQTRMSGDDNSISFKDVRVETDDQRLTIAARGDIKELKDKYKLNIRFHVDRMHAKSGMAERVINQFPVKKFMMKQLAKLGNIDYRGDFAVLWKKEQFQGQLGTAVGKLDFNLVLDENTKYLNGKVSTKGIALGRVFDMDKIGDVICKADFTFDYSKPRTAKIRRQKGGKLPIGKVDALVDEASYKMIKVRNLHAIIVSDGAVATGDITIKGKRTDLLCSFSFTSTDSINHKLKVKPGIRFHGLSDEDKMEKQLKKEQERKQKEERKKQKAAEKAQRKAEKAAVKAAEREQAAALKAKKDAEKAALKAQKDAEKAQKDAQKAAQKAALKAQKDAEKAQKEAEKAAQKAARKAQKEAEKAAKKAAKEAKKAADD